jgi:hypothetical protein
VRPIPIRVAGFKGLFYKPLEKEVVLTNPALKRIGLFVFQSI